MKCRCLISSIRTTVSHRTWMIYFFCSSSSWQMFTCSSIPTNAKQSSANAVRRMSNARTKWSNLSFCILFHLFWLCSASVCAVFVYSIFILFHSILLTAAMLHYFSPSLLLRTSYRSFNFLLSLSPSLCIRCVAFFPFVVHFCRVPVAVLCALHSIKMQFHLRVQDIHLLGLMLFFSLQFFSRVYFLHSLHRRLSPPSARTRSHLSF